jgi:hypothetical protein
MVIVGESAHPRLQFMRCAQIRRQYFSEMLI